MTFQDENQLEHSHPAITLTASCRRFLSTTEVLYDATSPWLQGGRAKNLIESSESAAEAISGISANLLKHIYLAQVLLGLQSDAPHEYERLCEKTNQEAANSATSKPDDTSHELLSLVTRFARETADHIRSVRTIPPSWPGKQEVDRDVDRLALVIQSLDYIRWQILKEFAKLVVIFDDREDPDSDEPTEGWRMDREVMGKA